MPETKDLILRKAVIEDWSDMLHNIWSRPESAKYMFWDLTTTEAAAIARDHLGAKRFVACCRPENQASKGTLRHCNFFFTHSEEAVHPRDGYAYTLDHYAKEL